MFWASIIWNFLKFVYIGIFCEADTSIAAEITPDRCPLDAFD
jgi:hypothetical protein